MTRGPEEETNEALEAGYAEAFAEWEGTEDAAFWENMVADGLEDDSSEYRDAGASQREE